MLPSKPTHKTIREILGEYSKTLLTEHFGTTMDFGCKGCEEHIDLALQQIAELLAGEKKDQHENGCVCLECILGREWNACIDHLVKKINAPI